MTEYVKMFNPAEGRAAEINKADVRLALEQGWVQGEAPAEKTGGFASLAANIAERGASGATYGLSDVALTAIGGDEYRKGRAARDETWDGLGDIAEGVGMVAPALLSGGTSVAAQIAARTPAGIAARIATRVGAEGGVLRMAGGGAIEGALQGMGQQLSEEALTGYYGGADAVAERIWAGGRSGAIFGGIAGGAVGVVGRLAKKFSPTPDKLADWADSAAANSVMGSGAREALGADGALDIGNKLRTYRRPDGSRLIEVGDTPTVTRGRLVDEMNLLSAERKGILEAAEGDVTARAAAIQSERRGLLEQLPGAERANQVPDIGPQKRAYTELERARQDATHYKQRLSEARDSVDRSYAKHGLDEARARMAKAQQELDAPSNTTVSAAGPTRADLIRKQVAELEAELAGLQVKPSGAHAERLAELDDTLNTFKAALRGGGPDVARGDWVPLAGAAGAVMHGNVAGGVAGAVAGAASRAAGRRLPAIWATITDRAAAGDPARVMRNVLLKTNHVAASAASAWAIDEEEYYALRGQVRQLATGQAQREMAIGEVAPNVEAQMLLTQMRAAMHLEQTAPTGPRQTTNPNAKSMLGERPPDPQARHKWARRVQAVDDPYSVIRNPTMEGGQTLQAVYPRLFSEMRAMLIEEVERTTEAVPLQRKVALSLTFGVPLDPSIGAHTSMLNQMAYERLRQQRSARPNRGQAMATERKIWSGSEEIETAGNPR